MPVSQLEKQKLRVNAIRNDGRESGRHVRKVEFGEKCRWSTSTPLALSFTVLVL